MADLHPAQSSSSLTTRLHAEITTRAPGYEYASGDRGIVVAVVYPAQPYESFQFTLTADEALELAGQLEAQAKELRGV